MTVASLLTLRSALTIGALLTLAVGCRPAESERISAEAILSSMEQAYASASTYRDSGTSVMRATTPEDGREFTKTVTFSTVFHRPGDVRFAYKSHDAEWGRVLLATTTGVESWVEGAEIPAPHDSIENALRGATAPSSGVSSMVAPLLFAEAGRSQSLLNLAAATRLADEEVDGVLRLVVQGQLNDRVLTVWLDPETHLVTRVVIVAENVGPDRRGRVVQTVVLEPQFAVEIAPIEFRLGLGTVDG